MKIPAKIGIGLMVPATAIVLAFLLVGPERFWRVFGEPDLGPVAFETLQRRATPNDALACPQDVCRAPADIRPVLYPVDAGKLRFALAKVIAGEPRMTKVASDDGTLSDRYIQRSERLGFPDTIVVQFLDRGASRSTLAIYSRSQLGRSDLGANKARIERWLSRLAEQMQPVE